MWLIDLKAIKYYLLVFLHTIKNKFSLFSLYRVSFAFTKKYGVFIFEKNNEIGTKTCRRKVDLPLNNMALGFL